MMEMKKYKIKDICDINIANVDYLDTDIVNYLDTGNLTEGVIHNIQSLVFSEAPSRAQRAVKENTILYSTVRPNQKHYGIIRKVEPFMVVSTGFATLDVKEDKKLIVYAEYLYLVLTQQYITNHLQIIAENSVSAYPSISSGDIGNLDIDLPPLPEQNRIASILSALDKKIALNRQINQNLLAHSSAMATIHHAA